tara:strand:+ start:17231 stop:18088 length:858 start_codon:yes stop_codon:yes gene_type:complete
MQNDKKRFDVINKLFTKSNISYEKKDETNVSDEIKTQLQSYHYEKKSEKDGVVLYNIMDVVDTNIPYNDQTEVFIYIYSIEYNNNPILYTLLFNYESYLSFIKTNINEVDKTIHSLFSKKNISYKGFLKYGDKNVMCYQVDTLSNYYNSNEKYKVGVMFEILNIQHIENIKIDYRVVSFFLENQSLIHLYINDEQIESPIVVAIYSDEDIKTHSIIHSTKTTYYALTNDTKHKITHKFILFLNNYKYVTKMEDMETKKHTYIMNNNGNISFYIKSGLDIAFFYSY